MLDFFSGCFFIITTILARVPPNLTVYAQSKDVEVSAVDLDGNSLGQTVSFAGGDIIEATAPKIEGKRFIRAYVIDSETNKKEAIQSIESRGGRAYIKRINESVDALERSYLSTDTASKIYFEYLDLAKTVTVTYQPEDGKDIIVTGPPHLELVNGSAVGYFTVSVPRNAKPIIETKEVAFDQDVSTTKRTVYRYKITTSQDLNIPIRSEVKETLTITAKASNDGKHADDWKMSGIPACNIGEATDNNSYGRACVRQDYFYAQTEIVTGNITNQDIANKNSVGEQITESGVGNGISIVLVINIVSRMPSDIAGLFTNYVTGASSIGGKILAIIIIIAVVVGIIAYVVWLQDGVRHIGVQMSQKVQGRRQVGGQQSTIPLKVNTAGVIPIIFASSILQFPVVIASFFWKDT